jgi:hypothetical protein
MSSKRIEVTVKRTKCCSGDKVALELRNPETGDFLLFAPDPKCFSNSFWIGVHECSCKSGLDNAGFNDGAEFTLTPRRKK